MFHVVALYKFAHIDDPKGLKATLLPYMKDHDICGTIICAPEGVNGTIAGPKQALDYVIKILGKASGLNDDDLKWSTAREKPFKKTKVKIKPEIVTLRIDNVDPVNDTGIFVTPEKWNDILNNPDIVVLDTRNFYETEIGTFKGAVDPKTDSFTDFPDYVDQHLDPEKNKEVAMFCTGGIRCEKASAMMRKKGFDKVYQLHGGILKYLEVMSPKDSLWEGECFVFDDRVAISHGLAQGNSEMCYGCGYPVTKQDQEHENYEAGVCCPRCYNDHDEERKKVLRERHARIVQQRHHETEHILSKSSVSKHKQSN